VDHLLQFKWWNAEASCSNKNDGADEGGAYMEHLLKTGSIRDGVSRLLHQQLDESTKYPSEKASARAGKKGGLLIKKMLCCLRKHACMKKKLLLESKIKVLEKEAENLTFVVMEGRTQITATRKEHEALQTKLHNDLHKNYLITVQRNSLASQVKIMRKQRDCLSSTPRSTVGDMEVMKTEWDAMKLQIENLQGLCEDAAALIEELNTETTERDQPTDQEDDILLEAKSQAAYIEVVEDRDALKLEAEQLRGQCVDAAALKEQRDSLILKAEHQAANIVAIEKERDALKLETEQLRGQCKDSAALKEQTDTIIMEAKRQVANMVAIEKERDALKLEAEQLRSQCKDAAALKEQRDRLILEVKHQARNMKAIKEGRDMLKRETEQLRGQCKDTAALEKQRDNLIMEAKRQARNMKTIKEERDALKLEAEHFRCQCMDTAVLKEQLRIATVQRPELKEGRGVLVLIVTMFVICFSVGLLWTLRNSPNIYVSPFASLYKTLLSHNSTLSTAMPFHKIVV
jgi:hypothetical protein